LPMKIPLSSPDIGQAEIDAVTAVLKSGRLSLGKKLGEFEEIFASYTGAAQAAAVSSGTAALHLAIRALGIGRGDEVIVPSFSFIAVANSLRYEGAVPVFVDIDPLTLNLDLQRIKDAITPKTRAILAVHTFGIPAAMPEILKIARRHGLLMIEDACEALGADLNGKKVGTFGDVGVFGFYPNKQITTGEGGMLVTQSAEIASRVRSLRNHGRAEAGAGFDYGEVGYNYRLSELQCALGIEQMKRVETILQKRAKVAQGYRQRLESIPGLQLPLQEIPAGRISWFVYVVRLPEGTKWRDREVVLQRLTENGIEVGSYFQPIHLQPAFRDATFLRSPLLVTEYVGERTLALPFFTQMTEEQLDAVTEALTGSLQTRKAASSE
jgi:perosamine synthetase